MTDVREVVQSDYDLEIRETTLPELLVKNTNESPNLTAIRMKEHGIWKEMTWEEHLDRVRYVTLGLESLGFGAGDVLFTIGFNRPQQLWAWLGAIWLGGMGAPNYEDMQPEELYEQLELLQPSTVYAEDQQAVDKILDNIERADYFEQIVYFNDKGMFRYQRDDVDFLSFEEVLELGQERATSVSREYFREMPQEIDPAQPAMLTPTSGTTGTPKRVQLSHKNLVNLGQGEYRVDPLPPESDYFSHIPMAWVGEQMILMAAGVIGKWTANFPEQPETKQSDLREIGPEIFFSSPGEYESYVANVKARIENTTWFKQTMYNLTMNIGHRYAEYISGSNRDEEIPLHLRLLHWLSYWIMYRPILDKIGLKRGKNVYTGGAPLGEEHFQFYHALGVPLKQIWGQTEVCGFVTVHEDDDIRANTVGKVVPNVEVGVTNDQELVVRGPVVTEGYFRQPDKTAESIRNGWLYTDDFGSITEDGHVKIHDRMDNIIQLSDSTEVFPAELETTLKFNPYIEEAMVVGEDRPFLSAVLNIRYDNVAEWADQRDIQYSGYRDLSQNERVLEVLRDQVKEANSELADDQEICRFVTMFKQFDPDDDEVTRTGKLRREKIMERYNTLFEAIYDGKDKIGVKATITYQDGSTAVQKANLDIIEVDK
jgi:long-chain acyl-CoA synthetase